MIKRVLSVTALVFSFAVTTAQATVVNFDSGSSKMNNPPVVKPGKHQKRKVWVATHRSNGRSIKGHYVWR